MLKKIKIYIKKFTDKKHNVIKMADDIFKF